MRPRFVDLLEPYLGSLAELLVPGYAFMLVLGSLLAAIVIVDEARRAAFARRDAVTVLCGEKEVVAGSAAQATTGSEWTDRLLDEAAARQHRFASA